MSVRDRLEDARALLEVGRLHGGLIQILIAVAATSRKRYPQEEWDDNQAFRNFVYDEMELITGGPKYGVAPSFRGEKTPLEDILYKVFRNQLLHEATLPEDVFFTDPIVENGRQKSVLKTGTPFGFPKSWLESLATCVWLAPENDDLWSDDLDRRHAARAELGSLLHDSPYCRRPGSKKKKKKKKKT